MDLARVVTVHWRSTYGGASGRVLPGSRPSGLLAPESAATDMAGEVASTMLANEGATTLPERAGYTKTAAPPAPCGVKNAAAIPQVTTCSLRKARRSGSPDLDILWRRQNLSAVRRCVVASTITAHV